MTWEIFGGMSSFAEHQRIIHSTMEMLRINAQVVKKNAAWGTPAHRRMPRPWKCKFHMHALPRGVPVYPGAYKPWKTFPFGRSTRTRLNQGNTKAVPSYRLKSLKLCVIFGKARPPQTRERKHDIGQKHGQKGSYSHSGSRKGIAMIRTHGEE